MSKRRAHYVLSTHWDREWYKTFQDFRYQLVQLLDEVLDGLEDGRLRGPFQTDGQAILLEDYLEVRPERREQVERFAREGKLVIGPWYALPDEFLVSGESLIRNIQLGRQMARALGGVPSDAGFCCDLFGHNSQLPQIMAGFGIRGGFIWRGLNTIDTRHVIWEGADGTVLPCYRFGQVGYCSYALQVRHASWDPGRRLDPEQARERLDEYLQEEAERTETDAMLLFDGCDHQPWDQEMYAILLERMERDDEFEIVHTDLDAYLDEMLPDVDRITEHVQGEQREPGRFFAKRDSQWVIPGVLSSRVWINQSNTECETLLCKWAEPFAAYARAALGREYPQGFLNVAWKWLLKNHPHDSICGCSIDQVHEDMKFRYSQCRAIATRLQAEATTAMAAAVEGDLEEEGERRVVVFNPLTRPFAETTELTLQLPTDWPTFNEFFGYEPKPAFRIYDQQGNEVPYQRIGQAMGRVAGDEVGVSLPLEIPAFGYTTLTVRAGQEGQPTRHPMRSGLATSERSMENEHLAVTIEANGSLTVTDKRTGQTYERWLTFEDSTDIGDGWYWGMAVNDRRYLSTASPAAVSLVHDGPMLTTFRVRTVMQVPAAVDFARMIRSEELVDLVIESQISLRPGVDRLEVETIVHNNARDHRLRVLFPTGADAETYYADSPYDVVERDIALREDNYLYRELEVETKPQRSWTAVADDERGLAVVSAGLLESAVQDLPERPIALTLYRSTRRTVKTDGEPGGQLLGELRFRYWLVPMAGQPERVRLLEMGQQVAAGLRDVQLGAAELAAPQARSLAPTAGFLEVEGPVVVTSVGRTDWALQVRLFNPTDAEAEVAVRLPAWAHSDGEVANWTLVDLEGRSGGEPAPLQDGAARFSLGRKKIATLWIRTG